MDAASLLKRFFFCEQSLIISQAGWLAAIASLEVKLTLPRMLWEDALTADALRNRVFELRYPNRLMDTDAGDDASLARVFEAAIDAPGPEAFVLSLTRVFKPALHQAYRHYLMQSDEIADGPTRRFLRVAADEKAGQIETLETMAAEMLDASPAARPQAEAWCAALAAQLDALGGATLDPMPHPRTLAPPPPRTNTFALTELPARDPRFHLCRFYWPDILGADFPYGEGIRLQLRSAVSHLNEVWAVETAGAILHAFAAALGWEFVLDAARWAYDESRHCRMGYERLLGWEFERREMPLGTYIYDSARGQDPIYRLGMLFFFETKNIGKKAARIRAFDDYHDSVSRHDMEYDWADETIHAHYGQRWLRRLLDKRGLAAGQAEAIEAVRVRCADLVAATVNSATPEERAQIRTVAEAMIRKAETLAVA